MLRLLHLLDWSRETELDVARLPARRHISLVRVLRPLGVPVSTSPRLRMPFRVIA
jgi:hypothetical protein